MLLKRKPKTSTKNLSATLQVEIDLLVNKLEYTNNKRSSKLSLPNVLEPSKLLLLTQSLVFTNFLDPAILPDCIRQASPASFGKSPKLPKLQNTLYTLNRCELYLSTNLLSRYDNGKGKGKETTMISL